MLDTVSQCRSLNQLQHQSTRVAALLQAVDAGDVGMVQRGEDSGFTLEPGQAFGVIGEQIGQDLEGHIPAELRVPGPIHLPLSLVNRSNSEGFWENRITGGGDFCFLPDMVASWRGAPERPASRLLQRDRLVGRYYC